MSKPERPVNTFYAFCSLVLPGLGQLLQKRFGAAIGFFVLFLLSGFLPVLIVTILFMDRFVDQPMRIHLLHIFTFGGLYFLFLLAIFWSVMDAAGKPGEKSETKQEEKKEEAKQNEKPKGCSCSSITGIFAAIAGVGLLVALLLPAVPTSREAARRMQCTNNMKQIMLAFHTYHDNYGCFPPAYTVDEDGKPQHSWRVLILPYLEQVQLYEQIRLDEPWDSEHNSQFHSEAPSVFRCPSGNPGESDPVPATAGSFYSVIVGADAAFFESQTKSSTEEERENTIFLVERKTPVNWMDPSQEITFETACKGINVDSTGISSNHSSGVNIAFGDGSVGFLEDKTDNKKLREMLRLHKK